MDGKGRGSKSSGGSSSGKSSSVSSPYTRSARVYCNGTSKGNEASGREPEESALSRRESEKENEIEKERNEQSVQNVGV